MKIIHILTYHYKECGICHILIMMSKWFILQKVLKMSMIVKQSLLFNLKTKMPFSLSTTFHRNHWQFTFCTMKKLEFQGLPTQLINTSDGSVYSTSRESTLKINFWHFIESHFTLVIGCDFQFLPNSVIFVISCKITLKLAKFSFKISQNHWNWHSQKLHFIYCMWQNMKKYCFMIHIFNRDPSLTLNSVQLNL